jgi:hypothetical protein
VGVHKAPEGRVGSDGKKGATEWVALLYATPGRDDEPRGDNELRGGGQVSPFDVTLESRTVDTGGKGAAIEGVKGVVAVQLGDMVAALEGLPHNLSTGGAAVAAID